MSDRPDWLDIATGIGLIIAACYGFMFLWVPWALGQAIDYRLLRGATIMIPGAMLALLWILWPYVKRGAR